MESTLVAVSLRDHFATAALQALIGERDKLLTTPQDLAQEAYELADAMIQASENPLF